MKDPRLLSLNEAELLCDEDGLFPHLFAPARDEGFLETHLRHRDTDRRQRRTAIVIAHRNAYAAEVRHELLDIDRETFLAHLADLASQLGLAGHRLRRVAPQRDVLHVLVEFPRTERREQDLSGRR